MQREFNLTPILINHQPLPSKTSWVKIFTYEPTEEDILSTRGKMYAVLSVAAKAELDFTPIMQLILEDIQREYFEKTEGSILQALEGALDGIHKKLILRAQQDKRLRAGFSFNLLTAVSWGTVLYFGQLGASRAGLVRHGRLYDIDEGEQKSTGLYLSSGTLEAGDRVVLTTAELFEAIDRSTLTSDLLLPVSEVAKAVEGRLGQGEQRLRQSGIVLVVDIKQVPTPEDEGLSIRDADSLRLASKTSGGWLAGLGGKKDRLKERMTELWRWKIGGKTPGLPLVIVGLAVVALAISMMWPKQQANEARDMGQIEGIVAQIEAKQDEAESIAEVNADRALDLLTEAEEMIKQGRSIEKEYGGLQQAEVRQLALEDRVLERQVLKPAKLVSLPISPSQAKLVWYRDTIYVVDSQGEQLVSIDDQGQRQDLRISNRYGQGSLLSATEDGLLLVSGGQAFAVDSKGGLSSGTVLNSHLQAEAITGYGSTGYVLDRTGQVYRLPVADGAVGVVSTYFSQVLSGDDYVDTVVDGDVYMIRGDGTIEVYLNGDKQNRVWERADLIKKPRAMVSGADSDEIFVWQDRVILRWTKQGQYLGQYRLPDNEDISMIGIDGSGKSLYILSEGNLLKAQL